MMMAQQQTTQTPDAAARPLDERLGRAWAGRARDPERTLALAGELLRLARAGGDPAAIAAAERLAAWTELSRSDFAAARAHVAEALELARACGDSPAEALALTLLGAILRRVGETGEARRAFEDALRMARLAGQGEIEAMALNGLGQVCGGTGEYADSFEHHRQALEIARRLGADDEEGQAVLGLGNASDQLARYRDALDYYHRALEIAERIGHLQLQAYATGNIGAVHERLGDIATALAYELRSLALKERLGDLWAAGVSLNNIGIIYKSMGHYAAATEHLLRALEIAERIGDRSGEMVAIHNIGQVYEALGERHHVLGHYQRVMRMAREMGDRQGEGFALGHLGRFHAMLGDHRQGLLHLLKGLRVHQRIGDRYGERSVLESIAALYRSLGQFERAAGYAGRALAIAESTEDRRGIISSLIALGLAESGRANHAAAVPQLERALGLARDGGFDDDLIAVIDALAAAHEAAGDAVRGGKYHRLRREHAQRIFNREETLRARQLIAGFERKSTCDQAMTLGLEAQDLYELLAFDAPAAPAGAVTPLDARPTGPVIVVSTFGALRVTVDGRELRAADWGRRKARELFKFLLIRHRRSVTIDEIIEKLWDGAAGRSAELLVMNAVSRIRRALEPDRSPRDRNTLLSSSERTYRLDLGESAMIDFISFKELVVRARRGSSAGERYGYYEEAAALFTDEFLKEDYYEEWSVSERELLKDAFLEALEYMAGERLRAGAHEHAGELARRILSFDAASERGYEVLLRSLVERGRAADALQTFEECRAAFRRELDADPPHSLLRIVGEGAGSPS